jgi:hypothetical protein
MKTKKMYACFAFFPDGTPKKWKYVTDLHSFSLFLTKSHPAWRYFNVYDKATKAYLKRFYPGNMIPKVLGLFLLTLALLKTLSTFINPVRLLTYENTFNLTIRKASESETTFTNGFNNSATIPTPEEKGGVKC